MNITIAGQQDRERWDRYVIGHPQGIAYQLFAWKEAVANAYGFKGFYLFAEKNCQIKGILPLICMQRPFLPPVLVSLPYCDAGGLLADSAYISKRLLSAALEISKALNGKMIAIRSTGPLADIDPALTYNKKKVRMILRLPRNSDQLLSALKAKVRSQVKKPLRDGLTSQLGGMALLDEFYPVFSENMRDLGSLVHSRNWLKQILKAFGNRAHLVVVRLPDGTPAAGGMILCHPNLVSVPWASSIRRYNRYNPNMLLYWTFLKFASDNGFAAFDFGRSTPGEGTYRFKKQWGAKPEALHWADIKSQESEKFQLITADDSTGGRNAKVRNSAEQVLRNVPLVFSKSLGSILRKYVSL